MNRQRHDFNRRDVLKAAAALAASAGLTLPAWAASPSAIALGDKELRVVSDGRMNLPLNFVLPDAPQDKIAALFATYGLPMDGLHPDCNPTLLKTGDRVVLFDAGAGPAFMTTTGKLAQNLDAAGIDIASVTDVILTHAHPDHIWGVVDDFDELLFPEAAYHINRAEWDFWRAEETLARMPESRKSFVVGARNRFTAIEERVTFFRDGAEIVSGVEAVATPGHTPGHTSFAVHGGGETVMVIGDAISNVAVSFERPDWHWGADVDQDLGAQTRFRLLDRLAADRARLIGFHLPYPGEGTVETKGNAYRFAPMA